MAGSIAAFGSLWVGTPSLVPGLALVHLSDPGTTYSAAETLAPLFFRAWRHSSKRCITT